MVLSKCPTPTIFRWPSRSGRWLNAKPTKNRSRNGAYKTTQSCVWRTPCRRLRHSHSVSFFLNVELGVPKMHAILEVFTQIFIALVCVFFPYALQTTFSTKTARQRSCMSEWLGKSRCRRSMDSTERFSLMGKLRQVSTVCFGGDGAHIWLCSSLSRSNIWLCPNWNCWRWMPLCGASVWLCRRPFISLSGRQKRILRFARIMMHYTYQYKNTCESHTFF